MLPSVMACSRLASMQMQRGAALRNHQQLIRNLFILSVSSGIWNSVKASIDVKAKPVVSNLPSSACAMNKNYCTRVNIPVVEYAEVKDLPNHPEKLLIDVREPREIEGTGLIPTAIRIPLGIVDQELAPHVKAEDFQKKYGRPKPDAKTYIIMQCRSGKRSEDAAQIAAALGYKNVHNYVGSWLEWADKEGLPKEPQ
ncbi:rhodanese domain-containing protein CG4456-like [Eupeodes corollae]|uniref:rhodanese domain-containing protein CG4456-like n=1 Tax=Eupeodes corollae TaxID=290404 RepID=UPI00248FAA6C|nr:rhodanese domain-containing protein CG4456-like [Eupeodes corollae]